MNRAVYIGGKEFDAKAVADHLGALSRDTLVVTGDGQGLEAFVKEQAPELGLKVFVPPLRPDLYDYEEEGLVTRRAFKYIGPFFFEGRTKVPGIIKRRRAKDIQVTALFVESLGNQLVLVGRGTRVNIARDILKRAKVWPLELVEL